MRKQISKKAIIETLISHGMVGNKLKRVLYTITELVSQVIHWKPTRYTILIATNSRCHPYNRETSYSHNSTIYNPARTISSYNNNCNKKKLIYSCHITVKLDASNRGRHQVTTK